MQLGLLNTVGVGLFQLRLQLAQFGVAIDDIVDGASFGGRGFLCDMRNHQVAGHVKVTRVSAEVAHD